MRRVPRYFLIVAALLLICLGIAAAMRKHAPIVMPPTLVLTQDVQTGLTATLHPLSDDVAAALPTLIGGVASPSDGGYRHEWPAFHAEARFSGAGLTLRLDDAAGRYRVNIDNNTLFLTRPGTAELRISGLSDGEHHVRLELLSESWAPAWFGGFFLPAGGRPLPIPSRARTIEFVGDSDSVGYGISSRGRNCSADEHFLTTDSSLAFPALVAKAQDADYRVIARSGITIVRHKDNMGVQHAVALPGDPAAPLAPEPPAAVIVIGLGSNDLIKPLTDAEWPGGLPGMRIALAKGIEDLARERLARSPGARLVLLAFGEYGPDLVEPFQQAQHALPRAELLILPELTRKACDWHPTPEDHATIAAQLNQLLSGEPS